MQNKLLKMAFILSLAISSYSALADDDDSFGTEESISTESTSPSQEYESTSSDDEDLSTTPSVPTTGIVEEDDESSYE